MLFDVLTIFPEMLEGFVCNGLIDQARRRGKIKVGLHNLRDFAPGSRGEVDDRPYGGGPGMVMKPEPFFRGVESLRSGRDGGHVVLLSARGELLDQNKLQTLSTQSNLILLCGRYEGIDARVEELSDDVLSVGNFVLLGGEVPAAMVIEGVSRMIEGVVGNQGSVETDSFFEKKSLGPPQYTRPPVYRGMKVPEVLLSGNHKKIRQFRKQQARQDTLSRRPDLQEE